MTYWLVDNVLKRPILPHHEISRFFTFNVAAVRHLRFLKLKILNSHSLYRQVLHHRAQFCEDR